MKLETYLDAMCKAHYEWQTSWLKTNSLRESQYYKFRQHILDKNMGNMVYERLMAKENTALKARIFSATCSKCGSNRAFTHCAHCGKPFFIGRTTAIRTDAEEANDET